MKRPIRWNVLLLVGGGYVATILVFVLLVVGRQMAGDDAYQIVQGPLMTLIGGSLAVAKDLLQLDSSESEQNLNTGGDEQEEQSASQSSSHDQTG